MATGADRILENLPPTFAPLPRPTALSALADAFGGELSRAENALAAVMFSHWVDYADTDGDVLTDLPSIASLYGLGPRDDETIEGFRAHLKRYVRTFIEGTVTVRGIFRIVAEALGMIIADDDAQLDTWWTRAPDWLTTIEPAGDDAATLLFGAPSVTVRGVDPRAAEFVGNVDLLKPIDLRGHSRLQLIIGGAPVTFDFAAHVDPAVADLAAMVAALRAVDGVDAEARSGRLLLRTAATGSGSSLELRDLPDDAAPQVLGLAAHEYHGTPTIHAQIKGTTDLPATLDLTTQRYLRIVIDNSVSFEVDCAGPIANATTPAQIVAAIQAEAGAAIASLVGQRLVLASPTPGLASTIAILTPTTGDATRLLLGDATTYVRGRDAAPATASGIIDLSNGVDLSKRMNIALAIDAFVPVIVNCAGAVPEKTLAGEIATAINAAVGLPVATQNGSTVTVTSRSTPSGGTVRFLSAPKNDALDLVFGFAPRRATGSDAASALFTGSPDLGSSKPDLRAVQRVRIAIDDGAPATIDFVAAGLSHAEVAPADIVKAINEALAANAASTDGAHLTLASPTTGDSSSVTVLPIETNRVRRFVSRAYSVDEASNAVLGTFAAIAQGSGALRALLQGSVDLHDGLDLRQTRYLRIALDGGPPIDVDCASASARPRAALLVEIVQAINAKFARNELASLSAGRLTLTSLTTGAASAVNMLPKAGDAAISIFGVEAGSVAGVDAQRLIFKGLADLSNRVDLSGADRVAIAIDGAAAVDIHCAGSTPAQTSAEEITGRINATLGGSYASTDGKYVRLASAQAGSAGAIAFALPAHGDATRMIFGISAPRTYHGGDAKPATLASAHDLPATLDLAGAPFLRLAIDGGTPVLAICQGADPAKTTLAEIAVALNGAFGAGASATAAVQGARVVVTSKSTGAAARIQLQPAADGDATTMLFGNPTASPGRDAAPAVLTGAVDLRTPVNLARRSILRVAIDDRRPLDIDVSGAAPDRTFGDEIKSAIDAELPGVATLDADGHLVLTSPSSSDDSRVEVQPLRAIELIEFTPSTLIFGPQPIKAGQRFVLDNDGAADSEASFTIANPGGLCGVDLIGLSTGFRVNVDAIAGADEALRVVATADGRTLASLINATETRVLSPNRVVAAPNILTAVVPFDGWRPLASGEPGTRPGLALVDPLSGNCVLLESRAASTEPLLTVRVVPASATAASAPPTAPRGHLQLLGRVRMSGSAPTGNLVDGNGATIAQLRANGGVDLALFADRMVVAQGMWYPAGATSLLAVDLLVQVFDIEIAGVAFAAVALDARAGAHALASRLATGGGLPVIARDIMPSDALRVPRGRSEWILTDCGGSRFDAVRFDTGCFAGGVCQSPGIFDVSRFNAQDDALSPSGGIAGKLSRFAPLADEPTPELRATWESYRPGAFAVNLPADLADTFGARFNSAYFASPQGASETHSGVVLDPETDAHFIAKVLTGGSNPDAPMLVYAEKVASVPLGWDPQTVPFRQPRVRYLSGGRANRRAALYIEDSDAGAFGIFARDPGAWGDEIAITIRYGGPKIFDIAVIYAATRFECARAIAYAGRVLAPGEDPLPAVVAKIIKPGPVGVVQAKAAGISVAVTREGT